MRSKQNIEDYEKFLVDMPDDDNPDFIENIRDELYKKGLEVVWENDDWFMVPNVRYHKPERGQPWFTVYLKRPRQYWWDALPSLHYIMQQYGDYEWVKRADSRLKTKKFFLHIFMPEID